MTKTEYLYGRGFDKKFIQMQKEVCEYKLEWIEVLIKYLLKAPYYARDWNEEVLIECEYILSH